VLRELLTISRAIESKTERRALEPISMAEGFFYFIFMIFIFIFQLFLGFSFLFFWRNMLQTSSLQGPLSLRHSRIFYEDFIASSFFETNAPVRTPKEVRTGNVFEIIL
jgi:hypothetical protein